MGANIDFNLTGNLVPPLEDDQDTVVSFNLPRKITNVTGGRAVADGAVAIESTSCTYEALLALDRMRLLSEASLVLTPHTYKEGVLYSLKPTYNGNGDFTVTRSTTATRVNSAGLVDLVPYNLVSWSEMFSDALWAKAFSSITANTITAPNGTLTADTLTADGTLNNHRLQQSFNAVIGTTYSTSCYVKKNTNNFFQIYYLAGQFSSNAFANFDLNNGVVGTIGTGTTASIQDVGNGWYRCTITVTATSSASSGANFSIVTSATSSRSESNSLNTSVFLWGAQIVEGTSARDYLSTETRLNIPRVDYSLGGCPNILLEPQRTNLALQSSSFDNATWVKTATTITANTTTSPSGVVDADTLTANGLLLQHQCQQAINTTSGVAYTISFYLKKDTNNFAQIFGSGAAFGVNAFANFDLNNGVLGSVGSGITAAITSVGNGWFRCSITATATATISGSFSVFLVTSATATRAETNTLTTSFFLWGAQLEAGAYATSFIPTTTASVTRVQDVVIKTGVSSLIGQTQGTLFLEARSFNFLGNGAGERISLTDGTFNNRINIDLFTGGNVQMVASNSVTGLSGTISATGVVSANSKFKIAVAYDGANSRLYVNGTAYTTIVGTMPTFSGQLSVVEFNQGNTARPFFGRVEELIVFPTRLSNAQLAQLTTL